MKSTLELSSDPTAEGRLFSRDKGSAGTWHVDQLHVEEGKVYRPLFHTWAHLSSAFMVSQCTTVELSDLTMKDLGAKTY